MRLQDSVEQLFADNPDLDRVEAVKKLKEEKNPKTKNKSLWKTSTIRSSVGTYLNKKKKEDPAMHIKSPVKTTDPESNLKIEGKEIERHRPTKDPFAIKPETKVEDKVDQMKVIETAENAELFKKNAELFKKEIIDGISKKVLEQASIDAKPFRDEIISIVSKLNSAMVKVIIEIREEISNLQTQGIPAYEPAIQYGDLNLKQSTIDIIQKNTEYQELNEESEYIDNLMNYYEPIVKNKDKDYESVVEYGDLNLKQSTIDIIQKNTEEKELKEESDYIDSLIENEKEYISKVLKIPS